MPKSDLHESIEIHSCKSFVEKFKNKHGDVEIRFHDNGLQSAIDEVRELELATDQKRLIILYLHNDFELFSKEFCTQLTNKELTSVMIKDCYLVAWDITDDKIRKGLKAVVKKIFGYNIICEKLMKQKSSIFLISSSISILEKIEGTTSLKHFPFSLKHRLSSINAKHQQKTDEDGGVEEICSERFQQLMCDYLGDRDFDSFEYDEHEYLKNKIYFSIYGPPNSTEEDKEKNDTVNEIYKTIRAKNNKYAKWDDKIVLSFIYNCIESLNSLTSQTNPLPIFVVRKCKGNRKNSCRLFIDLDLRVYSSWTGYILENKLPVCKMILPKDGKYKSDLSGNVLLEIHKSPRCTLSSRIIRYVDIIATVLGLLSAFAMIGSFFYSPLALPAGIIGLISAIYCIIRSSMQIHDRRIHKQDLNVRNSEARDAYLNIIGSSIGIVGGALTRTVAMIASKGIRIGRAVLTTVNAFNYAGMSTDFVSILNAIHSIKGSKTLDPLQLLQFTFSVLFFNNSVVNLVKTKGLFVQSEITQSMKVAATHRHNTKTTEQRVTHLRSLHSDDVMKTLSNPMSNVTMTRMINFSSNNGRISLNNTSVNIMRQTVVNFQGMYLPPSEYITRMIQAKFLTNEEDVELYVDILYHFPPQIRTLIVDLAKKLLNTLKEETMQFDEAVRKIFPHSTYVCKILEVTVLYLEDKYNTEGQPAETDKENRDNFYQMVEEWCASCDNVLMDLMQFYLNWITTAIYEYEHACISRERRKQAQKQFKIKILCEKCGGHYYKHDKNFNKYGII